MQPSTPQLPTKLIVAGVIVVLLLIASLAYTFVASKNSAKTAATPTPTPDAVAKGPLAPTYSGFDNLLDHGVTNDQVDATKYAFTKYAKSSGKSVKEVVIDTSSLNVPDPNQDLNYGIATFKVSLDGKTSYYATLNFSRNLTAIQLFLSASRGGTPVIYDSGSIDLYEGTGE